MTAYCNFWLMTPASDFQFKLHWTLHKEKFNVIFIDCHIISKIFPCNIISCIINSYPIIDLFILVPEVAAKNYACSIWYNKNTCLLLKITCTCHQVKIKICCQTPMVAPNLHRGFWTCWIQICHQILSLTTPGIQALISHLIDKCLPNDSGTKGEKAGASECVRSDSLLPTYTRHSVENE